MSLYRSLQLLTCDYQTIDTDRKARVVVKLWVLEKRTTRIFYVMPKPRNFTSDRSSLKEHRAREV